MTVEYFESDNNDQMIMLKMFKMATGYKGKAELLLLIIDKTCRVIRLICLSKIDFDLSE